MKTNGIASIPRSADKAKAAFTLTDLLVVLVVLAFLLCLGLSARAGTKGRVHVAQCASNLKQFTLAMHLYGNEYGDKLPAMTTGAWLWDMEWFSGNVITQWISWRQLYCPGTSFRFTDQLNYNLWNFAPTTIHILGYAPAFNGFSSLIASNQNFTLTPQRISVGGGVYLPAPPAAQRVLLADATISGSGQYTYALRNTYNYTAIPGGFPTAHLSPHLNGTIPEGGNLGMLDGHVEWRDFDQMQCRVTGGNPGFWW